MAFFYDEIKKDPPKQQRSKSQPRRDTIPIESLRQMSCSVCPRDTDSSLRTPKMKPSGASSPLVYVLATAPSRADDDDGSPFVGEALEHVLSKFARSFHRHMRHGYIVQCGNRGDDKEQQEVDIVETECCRNRVIADIEQSKPKVIAGVGDAVMRWLLGPDGKASAMVLRGRSIVVRVGNHVCWYMPLLWPNYLHSDRYGKSEYEVALEHDCRAIERMAEDSQPPTSHYIGGFDRDIEIIKGSEGGDFQRLERTLADLASEPEQALDIETNGLRVYNLRQPMLICAAVGVFDRTVAFSIDHPDGWHTDQRRQAVRDLFGEYLLYSGRKYAHNLAMELEWLLWFYGPGVLRLTDWGDTMAMAHTIDERPGTKSLDTQTLIQFGFALKSQSEVDPSRPEWWNIYPLADTLRYNGLDTKWTDRLRREYQLRFCFEHVSQWAEYERKVRLAPTLVLMEARGLPIDVQYAADLQKAYRDRMAEIENQVMQTREVRDFERRIGRFSVTNNHDILKLMRDVLKRDECRVKVKGVEKWSVDEDVLGQIPAAEVPSAQLIVRHRGLDKLVGTYLEGLVTGRVLSRGRIHSKYSSMVAVTGRLAAEDPAVQNWPIRTADGRAVRGAFVCEHGGWILSCDYGAIEARCFAMASGDENLRRYMWTKYDIHKFWAERFLYHYPRIKDWVVDTFDVDWDEKGLKTLRQEAKNKWVFPKFFGASNKRCSAELHTPIDIVAKIEREFWDEFPDVKRWQEELVRFWEKHLYVETLTGRRRRGPMTLNELLNHPIQGTAFDIVGAGMDALSERAFETDDWELQQVLQVHDDDTFLISDQSLDRLVPVIATEMVRHRFDWINVPLVVEMKAGARWSEMKEFAEYRSDQLFNLRNPYDEKKSR